ncbi:MAG: hypothetical protein Q8Q49_05015 [bacterium]|nr:hypothetical protein [bacterium]
MLKTPLLNSLAAILYITLVATVMFYGTKHIPIPNSFLGPIAVVSLFTLSAAVMGYLFLYQPLQLYLGDKKQAAVQFFLQTVGIFAGITVLIFILLFSGVIR